MKKVLYLACAAGLMVMITACNQTPDTHAADVQAIKTLEANWNQDFAAKDAEKLTGNYAADAVFMATGAAPLEGKEAIHKMLGHLLADPAFSLKFQASKTDAAKSGDVAWSQGTYAMTATDPSTKQVVNYTGSYVTVYKKQADGSWKAVSDIVSSS